MPGVAISNIVGFEELVKQLNRFGYDIQIGNFVWLVMRRATPEFRKLYRREIVKAIRSRTTRRTGKLLRVRIRTRSLRSQGAIILSADFPSTRFTTRRGGQGQYGFIVNHYTRFLEEANLRTRTSPQLNRIITNAALDVVTTRFPVFQRG